LSKMAIAPLSEPILSSETSLDMDDPPELMTHC